MITIERKEFPQVDIEKYLESSLKLNGVEEKAKDYILPLLPETIIDFHTHAGLPQHSKYLDQFFYSLLNSTYPHFSFELHRKVGEVLWGESKVVRQVAFAFPFAGVDVIGANEYIQAQRDGLVIPFLTGDIKNLEYTIREIESGRWYGLKMYPHQQFPKARKINEFYPPCIIRAANKHELPLITHLPKDLFTDSDELLELARSYPMAKFIVAHAGNVKEYRVELPHLLSKFVEMPNVLFDTACVIDDKVILAIIETLGVNRVIFGSDQPLNLIRATICPNPQLGYRVAVDADYHWANSKEQRHYRESLNIDFSRIANLHFGSLIAITNAIAYLSCSEDLRKVLLRKIFYQNALGILPREIS